MNCFNSALRKDRFLSNKPFIKLILPNIMSMKNNYWTNFKEFLINYQNLLHLQNDIP